MRTLLAGLVVLLAWPPDGSSAAGRGVQQLPALAGQQFSLASPETGATYQIHIRLPQNYSKEPAQRYPIVYLLDGDSLFPLLAAQHLLMTVDDGAPEAIIVGIGYGSFDPAVNRRDRDYVDGAAAFHRFLKDRLIPNVERRVRADRQARILFGQSRGGRFVLRSAYLDPDLFWGRIASNPSPEPDGRLFEGEPAPHEKGDGIMIVVSGTKDHPANVAAYKTWSPARSAMLTVALPVTDGTHSAGAGRNYRAATSFLLSQPRFCGSPHAGQGGTTVTLESSACRRPAR